MITFPLPLLRMASVMTMMQQEKYFHSTMAGYYHAMFNSFKSDETPETVAAIGYPPLIAFYQEQAQFHQCRVLWVEAKMIRYAGICDRNSAPL